MVDKITSWKFAEDYIEEPQVIARARARAEELGIESVTPSVGAHLSLLVNATNAKAVVEVGTGAGVSGLWLLSGNQNVVLASIETESEYQNQAKVAFNQAGIPSSRLRLINGKSIEVLTNLADEAYDLVLLDGDRETLVEQVGQCLRLLRPGGILAIAHALWRDRVPDAVLRDDNTLVFRQVLETIANIDQFIPVLSPVGDGLLLASKRQR
ncbi:MAG: O-methyltransferase [Acidobacteria bacterium]|nr:O-methyltransferase [Acidobacteriota bacterium]NDC47487.1 O-methyltransferase [Micrococcales bacterium]